MMPLLSSSSLTRDAAAGLAIGPVTGHRIAQIRRRIRQGRYPLDSIALASEIALHDRNDLPTGGAVGSAVEHLLSVAIDRLDHYAVLILQLEFVEQLAAAEIAVTVRASVSEIASMRSAALLKLKGLLDTR